MSFVCLLLCLLFVVFKGFLLFCSWCELCLSDLFHDSQQIRASELVVMAADSATHFNFLLLRRALWFSTEEVCVLWQLTCWAVTIAAPLDDRLLSGERERTRERERLF